MEIAPVDPVGGQHLKFLPEFLSEVRHDFLAHVELRRRREACDRSRLDTFPLGKLPNKTGRVQVIRTEIVPPFRDTVGFIEYPRCDLSLADRILEPAIAQLLGRHVQQSEPPHQHAFKYIVPLRHGEQAVHGRREARSPGLSIEVLDLVLHECLERGEHYGKGAGALVVHDRGQLKTQRLTAAGRQDPEQRAARQRASDDPLLKTLSVCRCRRGAKAGMLEVLPQLLARVVLRAAIRTFGVVAFRAPDGLQ